MSQRRRPESVKDHVAEIDNIATEILDAFEGGDEQFDRLVVEAIYRWAQANKHMVNQIELLGNFEKLASDPKTHYRESATMIVGQVAMNCFVDVSTN